MKKIRKSSRENAVSRDSSIDADFDPRSQTPFANEERDGPRKHHLLR